MDQDRETTIHDQEGIVALNILDAIAQLRLNILLDLLQGELEYLLGRAKPV